MKIELYHTGPLAVNTYLAYDEAGQGFLVDPGGHDNRITKRIKELGITPSYILLTHAHGDHIGGVPGFKQDFPEIRVCACKKETELLGSGELNSSIEFFGREITIEPDLYGEDGDTLTIGSMTLRFIETPGHTKGGMCIYSEADGILFSGDTLFQTSVGRTDFYGGSFPELIASLKEKLFLLPDDTKVLPGHMGATTIGVEKRYNPFV